MTDQRGVNTVLDVGLALLFISLTIALLSGLPVTSGDEHDPLDADRTGYVVGSSTLDVTYSVEPVLDAADTDLDTESENRGDLQRVSHGSLAGQVGDAAVANLTVEGGGDSGLTEAGTVYERAIDARVKSRLVGSQFETNVTAIWEPYDGAPIEGSVSVGTAPPPGKAISSTTITVPSGIEPVRDRAIDAVKSGGRYDEIAEIVAAAIVEGYLPELEAEHALEGGGTERTLTRYRYERMATNLGNASVDSEAMQDALRREQAEPGVANEYLTSKLATQLSADIEDTFDSPRTAAAAISTGEVAVTVRTWEP